MPAQQKLIVERNDILETFNSSLNSLKEEFHKTGRFDDANAKLDEIIKLLVIKYLDALNHSKNLSLTHLQNTSKKMFGNDKEIAKTLQYIFSNISKDKIFLNKDGTNIFGPTPQLNIQATDNDFAIKIIDIIDSLELTSNQNVNSHSFDLLNEAFGHFIRDNFRNNKEDAQYMTPQEVVDCMVEIVLSDISKDIHSKENLLSHIPNKFVVLDPTCGVGSFLIYASRKITNLVNEINPKEKQKIIETRNNHSYVGQDKVDRMVRLSKINQLFFGLNPNLISQGNSIVGQSSIDEYIGIVDLIITNPPFGAEFNLQELASEFNKYEILPKILKNNQISSINSELLILDRSLRLLKPGGRLLIIVPDSVVSSKGLYETYRYALSEDYLLKAVIDLPSVTFAQAGTRTKCSILYIQKPYEENKAKQNGIFMAVAKEIGYEVKEKMGTTVKTYDGKNDLQEISKKYIQLSKYESTQILSNNPSVVICPFNDLINGKWNANFYNSDRIESVNKFNKIHSNEIEIKTLKEVAEFITKQRRRKPVTEEVKCISVLHISDDSTIRFEEVLKYNPTCSGIECYPNEILFSKINPRIPRIVVIPEVGYHLTCSTEFEIIKPFDSKYLFLLKTLLLSDIVQKQINSLTSGTSSSHNRIKDSELINIKLPWPKKDSKTEKKLLEFASLIQIEENNRYHSQEVIRDSFKKLESLIGI